MKKLLLFFCALLTLGVSGAWAQTTVTIADQTDLSTITNTTQSEATATHKYGVYSGSDAANTPYYTTFTTNITSGVPGVTISSTDKIIKPTYVGGGNVAHYGHLFAIQTSGTTASDITITAPTGYKIKSYAFTALSTSDSGPFTITPSGESAITDVKGYLYKKNINVTVDATTAKLTVQRTANNAHTLCIPTFTVTLEKIFPFTYTVSPTTGTFYNNVSSAITTNGYANKWLSADSHAQLQILTNSPYTGTTNSGNNMVVNVKLTGEASATPFRIHTDTYHLSVPFGYIITDWSITGYTNYTSGDSKIKGETISTSSETPTTVSATSLVSRTTSFAVSTASPWIVVNSMTVTIAEDAKTYIHDLGDLSNTKTYIVYGERGSWNTASADATQLTYVGTDDINKDNSKQQIAIIKSATTGKYYAYSVTAGKFLNGSATSGDPISLSDTPAPIFITASGNSNYPWFFSFTSDKSEQNINISGSAIKVMDYNTTDDGNSFCICEANTSYDIPSAATSAISTYETENVYVTCNLKFNGETVATQITAQTVGSAPVSPWDDPVYSTLTTTTDNVTNETTSIDWTINWDGPFTISSSFASATWYYMKLHAKYAYYDSSTLPYPMNSDKTNANVQYSPNAMWAFLGDPYTGIKVVNKRTGEGKFLYPRTYPEILSTEYSWVLGSNEYGFVLSYTSSSYWMNDYQGNGKLNYWNNASAATNDASAFTVEAVSYKDLAVADYTLYADSHHKGEYFGVDTDSYDTQVAAIKADDDFTSDDYTSYMTYISSFLTPRLPETGYYRIKSSGSRGGGTSYITYGQQFMASGSTNKGDGLITTSNDKMTDIGTIVYLSRVGSGKNYQLSLQGLNIQKHSGENTLFTATDADAVNFAFNHINLSGTCSIYDGTEQGNMHEAAWYNSTTKTNGVVGWTAGDGTNASSWSVEDATTCTIALNSDGAGTPTYYATTYLPFDATITGATAYTLAQSGDFLVPTQVTDNKVPAGTPVLLKGTSATATATINSGSAFSAIGGLDSHFIGTYTAITSSREDGEYILGISDGVVGFYKRGDGKKIGANKAYLKLDSDISAGVKGYIISWDIVDAINDIRPNACTTDTRVYDLSGRRISQPTRGLYIINGKKVAIQ
ncbi:MAG: hypothetical protein J5486_08515 [Bacteroidaceae bacterium]|nr:hypothetical protein [Bacteroidaceae bacterium]